MVTPASADDLLVEVTIGDGLPFMGQLDKKREDPQGCLLGPSPAIKCFQVRTREPAIVVAVVEGDPTVPRLGLDVPLADFPLCVGGRELLLQPDSR
jgi:hypothetical protein